MSTRSGRMFWVTARDSVITKMFSCPSTSAAATGPGILIGMLTPCTASVNNVWTSRSL